MYLIIITTEDGKQEAFYSEHYSYENNYVKGMIISNMVKDTITFDGINWNNIQTNHL